MSKRMLLIAAALAAVVAIVALGTPLEGNATACRRGLLCRTRDDGGAAHRRRDPVITAAGDIATADPSAATRATSRLVLAIDPRVALTLGDNQYPDGAYDDFERGYDPTWGRFKARTRPTLGNHEYDSSSEAAGYFRYFGDRAPNNYYSFDVGAWHLISLDSNCRFTGCESDTRQFEWLRHDLATRSAPCTLAYWHHPRWSSAEAGGDTPEMAPFTRLLSNAHADVLLTGHQHNYERFAPQTPAGEHRRNGIVEFVVGTGGKSLSDMGDPGDNSVVRNDSSYGVLRMTLHPRGYDFAFKAVLRSSFRDAGSRRCN
jgi:calcineurin-like phosphoesterase family protein